MIKETKELKRINCSELYFILQLIDNLNLNMYFVLTENVNLSHYLFIQINHLKYNTY